MRMIDADALLRAYDEAHEGPPGKARKLIEDAPTVVEWVSVGEHLPESGKSYLTIGPRGVMRVAEAYVPAQVLSTYGGDPVTVWWRCEGKFVAATHWMEKPAPPPKEGEANG